MAVNPFDERFDRWSRRLLLTIGLGAAVVALCFWGCRAYGQEQPVMLMPEIVYDDPTTPQALHRSGVTPRPIPALPPLPALRKISRAVSTNDQGERVTVTIEKPIDPPALVQDKPRTNAFWVACPHCSVRAIRAPLRMEINGVMTSPDGDTIERTIYFQCCQQEFRAKNFKFVETPIAEEVTVPLK